MKSYHELNAEREAIKQQTVKTEHKDFSFNQFFGYYVCKILLVAGALNG
jgi:hypothetical protein